MQLLYAKSLFLLLYNLSRSRYLEDRTGLHQVWLHNLDFGLFVYTVEKICDNSGENPSCSRFV
ncbi:hypothetical protein P3S68_003726 [Capsicum galapagoense]